MKFFVSQFSCAKPGRNEYRVYLDGSMGYPALKGREKESKSNKSGVVVGDVKKGKTTTYSSRELTWFLNTHTHLSNSRDIMLRLPCFF